MTNAATNTITVNVSRMCKPRGNRHHIPQSRKLSVALEHTEQPLQPRYLVQCGLCGERAGSIDDVSILFPIIAVTT